MKINISNINIEKPTTGTLQPSALNSNPKGIDIAEHTQGTTAQSVQNLSKKRAVIDAIIVNQMAGSFLHEAIRISTRLKSLASEAITTGRMKGAELTDALAGVKSSLKEIQEGFAVPSTYQMPVNIAGAKVELPQIKIEEEINLLNKFTDDTSSEAINLKKIDRISESLINKSSILDNKIKQLTDALSVPGSTLKISSGEKYPELVKDVANEIVKYPQAASKSQWNINSELVKSLL